MKTLTKYITATLLAITMFSITTILSITPTYAATSVDVYCDGVDDQDKISAVLADDTTINIYGDCVFTDYISVWGLTGVVLQGDGDTTFTKYAGFAPGLIQPYNSSVTINDIKIVRDPSAPMVDETDEGIDSYSSNLYLNNVTIDMNGFGIGVGLIDGGVLTATNLVIINTGGFDFIPELGGINVAIGLVGDGNVVNWISGRSDADLAIFAVDFFGTGLDIQSAASIITLGGNVLSDTDFELIWDDPQLFATTICVNQFVNNGFQLGTQWDCRDTGGGTEEPEGGNNGNEIEAPGTGIFGDSFTSLSIIIISIITMLTISAYKLKTTHR